MQQETTRGNETSMMDVVVKTVEKVGNITNIKTLFSSPAYVHAKISGFAEALGIAIGRVKLVSVSPAK